ncbi:MAG: twin-arginine translocase subunit TatC [Firmicutes bacterium]|nr:twin-arginine translocase subunit TatC [Bacillota bacterium]
MIKRRQTQIEEGLTLVEHLAELRSRIIICILTLIAGVLVGFYFSGPIVKFLMRLPGELVYLYPGEAFMMHLTVALAVGIILGSPIVLYQVIRFIVPGLLERERRLLYLGLPLSAVLFVVGVSFAYQVILPLAYKFFLGFGTESLEPMISIGNYISFVLRLVLPFGLVFQLPLIVLLLTGTGILRPETLVHYRKYMILMIFIAAAVLTPPDIISQSLMALPMVLLYELSIILAKVVVRRKQAQQE